MSKKKRFGVNQLTDLSRNIYIQCKLDGVTGITMQGFPDELIPALDRLNELGALTYIEYEENQYLVCSNRFLSELALKGQVDEFLFDEDKADELEGAGEKRDILRLEEK